MSPKPRITLAKKKVESLRARKFIKIVLVKWEDATHQDDETQEIGTMLVWTAGILISRSKKEISLCNEIFEDGSKRSITAIPMGMVRGRVLTLAKIPIRNEN